MPYVSYRLFHLYHVSLETPNAMQTSDTVLPERSGSIIILYLFSIISTCYYTPRLECQLCQEAKMSTMYGSGTTFHYSIKQHILSTTSNKGDHRGNGGSFTHHFLKQVYMTIMISFDPSIHGRVTVVNSMETCKNMNMQTRTVSK